MILYSPYLEHHGILGQKWGVRRYQNKDGSLTSEGRERYGVLAKKGREAVGNKEKKYLKTNREGGNPAKPKRASEKEVFDYVMQKYGKEKYTRHFVNDLYRKGRWPRLTAFLFPLSQPGLMNAPIPDRLSYLPLMNKSLNDLVGNMGMEDMYSLRNLRDSNASGFDRKLVDRATVAGSKINQFASDYNKQIAKEFANRGYDEIPDLASNYAAPNVPNQ